MGSITSRKRTDGSVSYTAQIRLTHNGKVVHSEAKTFTRRALAEAWQRKREYELERVRATGQPLVRGVTLETLIEDYIRDAEGVSSWGRSKKADLNRLKGSVLAERDVSELQAHDYMDFIRKRRASGVSPATALNDVIWIHQVLLSAAAARGLNEVLAIFDIARRELLRARVIGKSKQRERRLKQEEEKKLMEYFARRDKRSSIPMSAIVRFALLSARRQEEICSIKRSEIDMATATGWLDDVKHPRHKLGNRRQFKMTLDALKIIQEQPVHDGDCKDIVFPYNPKSIGTAFTRACKYLGIEDLHFHDLRHEATSRLFERGYQIHEVAQFTLHESWATLKRYTHLKPADVPERKSARS